MNYARAWQRFIGGVIDILITLPLSLFMDYEFSDRFFLSQFIFMLFESFYYVIFWFFYSATPGMMLMRIRIESVNRSPITLKRAVIRYLGIYVSSFCLGLGFLWMLWDKKKQTWQDKMARTIVSKIESGTRKRDGSL